jgi:hypothetical protein
MLKKRRESSACGALKNEKGMTPKKINFSDIPDLVGKMKKNGMRPVPPGEILNEEFLKPQVRVPFFLARMLGAP